ncbi:hypothetical protein [Spirillospora sp. NPDC029432]|uniref:hypothetical protein n=1 Tax=Spirillospora sp. NPDC029432 TaxID=3154599 RepID=UPI003452A279
MTERQFEKATAVPPIDLSKPDLSAPAPVDLAKPAPPARRPVATQAGPAWIVVPARVVAVVFVLPFRLAYDLLKAFFSLLGRAPRWLGRGLRAAYLAVLHPILRPIGLGLAWLWTRAVYAPLRWLVMTLIVGGLRLFGRGTGRAARWFYTAILAPIGRVLAAGFRLLVARPAKALWHGALWLLNILVVIPAVAVWGVLAWLGKAIGTGIAFLVNYLIVVPAVALWRYVLKPPLMGLAWLARVTGTGIAAGWAIFAGAVVWAWRMLGRLFALLGRALFVIPAVALYRYVLRPIGHAVAWTWRAFVVAPCRAVKNAVLLPTGRAVRSVWRGTASWTRANVTGPIRQAARDVRMSVRRAFRG